MILDSRIIRFLKDLHSAVGFSDEDSQSAIANFEQAFLQRVIARVLQELPEPERERVITLSTKTPTPKPEEISNLLNSLITTAQRDRIAEEEAAAHAKEYIVEIIKNASGEQKQAIRALIDGLSVSQ